MITQVVITLNNSILHLKIGIISSFRMNINHNHMTIEPVIEIFGRYDGKTIAEMRDLIFKNFAASENYGMIFTLMVDFTHATTPASKQQIFDQMSALLPRTVKTLTKNQQEYYSKWYYVVVRESLAVLNINDKNIQELALFLNPKITLPQAKQAIQLLLNLGLVELAEDGFYRSVNKAITNGSEIAPLFVHQFQKQMIDLGKSALDHYSTERRNVSCMTMSVSAQGLERIISKIDLFRKEIVDIVRSDEGESMVCEMNIQFFPLSKEKTALPPETDKEGVE